MMARGRSKSNGKDNGATLGFEAKLWQAADALRNNMDAATSVKIPKYQYVGFDFPILDEMW